MTHQQLLFSYAIVGLIGLLSCATNWKHAMSPMELSPVPHSAGYYCAWRGLYFVGMTVISLLAATNTTNISRPGTTGIGSYVFLWLNLVIATEATFRAVHNGIVAKRMRDIGSDQQGRVMHPMIYGR